MQTLQTTQWYAQEKGDQISMLFARFEVWRGYMRVALRGLHGLHGLLGGASWS